MVLVAICGNLGAGKTACATFLAQHFKSLGYNIFANYQLKNIDYKFVVTMNDLEDIHNGYFFGDELWLWLDSRSSSFDEYNKRISDVLLKSRKRGYNLIYTAQGLYQIDKRIRNITDFIIMPEINYYNPETFEMNVIEQSFLYPLNLKPYLENMIISAKVCVQVDENTLREVDSFSFWMKNIINAYDTSEEVEDIKSNLHKGIIVENKFANALRAVFKTKDGCVITQSLNSGQYQNTLDVELLVKNELFLFDVCTVQKRKVSGYEYYYIDIREKDIDKILNIGLTRNAKLFFAFAYNGNYQIVPISVEIFDGTKDMINVTSIKDKLMLIQEFKEKETVKS